MNKLFAVSERYENIMRLLDDENVPEDIVSVALEALNNDLVECADERIKVRNWLKSQLELAKEEKKKIEAIRKRYEKSIEWYDHSTITAMDKLGTKSINAGVKKLCVQNNPPSVVIDDLEMIPAQYCDTVITKIPRKDALKRDLIAGKKITGCHIEISQSIRIR